MPSVRVTRPRARSVDDWIDHTRVLDSWVDTRWRRRITLYGLVEPLGDHGYVAVTRSAGREIGRTVVFFRNESELESLTPGTEAAELRRRARAVSRRRDVTN